jgi:hypothetical protein
MAAQVLSAAHSDRLQSAEIQTTSPYKQSEAICQSYAYRLQIAASLRDSQ